MTTTSATSIMSSFDHMLTVYRGETSLKTLEKIERQEVDTEKGARVFTRYSESLLESSRFKLYACCKESKESHRKKYALLSAYSTASELFSEKALALHKEAAKEGIALKIQKFTTPLEKGYYSHFAFYGDLLQLLGNAEELHEETKLFFAKKIIELVDRLHRLNIAHQDIKLENILVDQVGEGELVFYLHNFTFATKNETTTVLCGSENYLPMYDRISHVVHPKLKDLFSLGVLLFSLFTKKMWKDEQDHIPMEWKRNPMRYSILIEEEYKKILDRHLDQIPRRMIPLLEGFLRVCPFDRIHADVANQFLEK